MTGNEERMALNALARQPHQVREWLETSVIGRGMATFKNDKDLMERGAGECNGYTKALYDIGWITWNEKTLIDEYYQIKSQHVVTK